MTCITVVSPEQNRKVKTSTGNRTLGRMFTPKKQTGDRSRPFKAKSQPCDLARVT